MKCDKCKYLNIEFAGSSWPPNPPYSELWCGKGHWSGWIEDDQPEVDPWADCKDFEQKPALKPPVSEPELNKQR